MSTVALTATFDDHGVTLVGPAVQPLLLHVEGQYVWSFDPRRDGTIVRSGLGTGRLVPWPRVLLPYLDGTALLQLMTVDREVVAEHDVRLGSGEGRISVTDQQGRPLAVDKVGHLGRVFDAINPVPYKLPDHKTQSGWRTWSSPRNRAADQTPYNELKFEDDAGKEFVYIQAQRDLHQLVKHNQVVRVKRHDVRTVEQNQHATVKQTKRELIEVDDHLHVKGNRAQAIEDLQQAPLNWQRIDELLVKSREPLLPPMATLCINGGRKEKLRPGDIVGALTGEAGIPGSQVGKIAIFDFQAFVAVERGIAKQALKRLSEGRIKGRSYKVRII